TALPCRGPAPPARQFGICDRPRALLHVRAVPSNENVRFEPARWLDAKLLWSGFQRWARCHTRIKIPSAAWLAPYDSASVYRGRFRRALICEGGPPHHLGGLAVGVGRSGAWAGLGDLWT